MIYKELIKTISKSRTFVISSHVNQDGDCIGSQLAMYWYLTSLGKTGIIYNTDKLPQKFGFLENSDKVIDEIPDQKFDMLFVLDSSNPTRTGWNECTDYAKNLIIIDHHRDNSEEGDINIVDHSAAATCEIIYRFFIHNEIDFPDYVAEALYTGILTDTGGFQFSNTTSDILRISADLVDRGAKSTAIYKKIYASYSHAGLLLRSKIWSTLEYHFDNKLALMEMSIPLVDEMGADYGDVEGMSEQCLLARGVEVGLFIKYDENRTHFSLRSTGNIDVGMVAKNFPGGGGHAFAAGCTVEEPFEIAKKQVLDIIKKEL